MGYDKMIASLKPKPKLKSSKHSGSRVFYCPDAEYEKFVARCQQLGIPRSSTIRALVRDFLAKTEK